MKINKLYLGSHSFLKEKLLNIINQNKGKKITVIVHTNKQRIFLKEYLTEKLGIIYNIEFLTMMDLSKRITNIEPLQDFDKELIIKRILQQTNPELEGLYLEFSSLIEMIKEHQLKTEKLNSFIKQIINEYENFKKTDYYDREDVHIKAANTQTDFKTQILIIYSLKSLGVIHRQVLEKVNSLTEDIYTLLPIFQDSGYYQNYQFFKETIEFFKNLTKSEIEEEQTQDENIKTSLYIYKFDYKELPIENQNIILINPKNEIEELEFVASKIDEIIEQGNSFYQIGIIIPDISRYIPFIKEVFTKYKIPYYLSEQNRYIDDPLYKKLFSLFKIKQKNFTKESILSFLSPDIIQIKNFEKNYNTILKHTIKQGFEDLQNLTFKDLEENIKKLLSHINDLSTKESINYYIEKFLEINQLFITNKKLKIFLENILLTLKEHPLYQHLFKDKITYENFVSIIETFFLQENKENQTKGNTVSILSPISAEGNNFKYTFILNLNSSYYPPYLNEQTLASSQDLNGFSNTYHILMQSLANFSALLDKNKTIFISSLKASINNSYLSPSVFFEEIKRILKKDQEEIKINTTNLKDFIIQNAQKLADKFENLKPKKEYIQSIKNITKENFKYKVELNKPIPATKFKTYAYCPYKFFFDYVLNLEEEKEIDRANIPQNEIGKKIHEILEKFYKNLCLDENCLENKKKEINQELEDFFKQQKEYLIPSYEPFEKSKLEKIKENLFYFIEEDIERIKKHNLQVEIIEKKYENQDFTGKIDRVDKDPQGNYYILDYKTGKVENILKEIKNKHIQLIIYKKLLQSENKPVKKLGILAINDKTGKILHDIDLQQHSKDLEEHLEKLKRDLTEGYFYPKKNNLCIYCFYNDFCLKEKIDNTGEEQCQ